MCGGCWPQTNRYPFYLGPDAMETTNMSLNTNIQRFFGFRRSQWLLPAVVVFASMVAGLTGFALRAMWNDEQPDAAAAALIEYCDFYAANHGNTYNQQWGVQHRGTMITQQLPRTLTVNCSETMRVWFSHPGLDHRREVGGWICVEADGAYAAVRPARGGYRWAESDDRVRQGDWMVLEDGFAPVILEVVRKVDYADYQAFQDAVLARAPQWSANRLDYTGLSGVAMTFHADCSAPPEIDGAAIACNPPKVFDSPFVSSEWNSATITITKDTRSLVLDFRGR
jgi:hypothetical protein